MLRSSDITSAAVAAATVVVLETITQENIVIYVGRVGEGGRIYSIV